MELSVHKTQHQQPETSSLPRTAPSQNAREAFATVLQTMAPGFLFSGFNAAPIDTLMTRTVERALFLSCAPGMKRR